MGTHHKLRLGNVYKDPSDGESYMIVQAQDSESSFEVNIIRFGKPDTIYTFFPYVLNTESPLYGSLLSLCNDANYQFNMLDILKEYHDSQD